MAYSSTVSRENGTRSGCLVALKKGFSIHKKTATTTMTANAVRLEAALGLLFRGISAMSGIGVF